MVGTALVAIGAESSLYNGKAPTPLPLALPARAPLCRDPLAASSPADLLLLPALFMLVFPVDAGHRALIFDRYAGVKPTVYGEGTHMLVPVMQRPIIMDVRTTPRSIATQTGTKDLQNVNLSLRVLTHPSLPHLAEVYNTLGTDYSERVLPGICNEVLKAVVAQVRPRHDNNSNKGEASNAVCADAGIGCVCALETVNSLAKSHSAHSCVSISFRSLFAFFLFLFPSLLFSTTPRS
jgi:hypothetical protein